MAKFWGKEDDNVPEELKGLSPAEIADAVRKSKTLEADITSLKETSVPKSQFETLNAEHSELKTRLDALESAKPTKEPKGTENKSQELTDFLVDGNKAFAERAFPIATLALETKRDLVKSQMKQKLGPLFTKWEGEIDGLAATIPLLDLCRPNTWEYLFYNVKGRHAEEKDAFVVEGVGGHHRVEDAPDPKASLTDQEKKIAKKLGIKEEDYLKQKQSMREGIPAGVVD